MKLINRAITSEELGLVLGANPVVVRRIMALLKRVGYVNSEKGHHGGWRLSTELSEITLFDIYNLLGEKTLFTIALSDEYQNCLIEKAVNTALADSMQEAEKVLFERFREVDIESLLPPISNG
ncbi:MULTISPECIES: Rrf2 family transcriptional regulator [unclassified Pseudoalteromonas]|nr:MULTISPECIES: Rrf2 family transcriptional regulator [unclassified Pseudoalteromonas]WJE08212.1 Rrf2 family transcriptional regulator [Pseudoalteromonas sp. JC3]